MLVYFFFCLLLVDLSDFFEDFVLILPEEFPKPGAAGSIPAGGALIFSQNQRVTIFHSTWLKTFIIFSKFISLIVRIGYIAEKMFFLNVPVYIICKC